MPLLKVENREGVPLVAEIYKGSELIGKTDAKGELELPKGDYKAKAVDYDDKSFRVHNQATPNFVVMASLSQVNTKSNTNFFKKLSQQDWIVLIAVAVGVVAFATFYHVKTRRNAKI